MRTTINNGQQICFIASPPSSNTERGPRGAFLGSVNIQNEKKLESNFLVTLCFLKEMASLEVC